ncbi:MAG: tRNA (N(6)-L-threonylcarbamoyladenosine(37)-C(2))-methylthiotransferase MtaB [Chloroflexia bacterium]
MAELTFIDTNLIRAPERYEGPPRVAFVTLGCKVNQSDTQKAITDFRAAGFRIVPPSSPAEVYVVNTCSVTHVADRKSRQWLRRAARANPDALVVATGCYAESGRETLEDMPEVGVVVGYKAKDDLLGLVLDWMPGYEPPEHALDAGEWAARTPSWAGGDLDDGRWTMDDGGKDIGSSAAGPDTDPDFKQRTRAMVKVEDGCNDFCTFCIIPFTRGMPRSTPTNEVVRLANRRVEAGYKEIVLTGVHMGKYGQDHAQRKRAAADPTEAPDLPGVVKAVLERTEVPRLRVTSVEPTDAVLMLPLLSDSRYLERLAPHLHLPLQSGCDATLERMKRDYTTAEYKDVVRQCREAVPGISITTDLIVGFPGETEEEWAETLAFVGRMQFARVHVFPYSRRPGTPAATMGGQVTPEVSQERTRQAIDLGARLEAAYSTAHLGSTLPVLWEEEDNGTWSGLTDNYLRVHTRSPHDLHNAITPATLTAYDAQGLWGDL